MLRMERIWEMPHRYTFSMKCVQALLKEEMVGDIWIDPFCGQHSPARIRNDADSTVEAGSHEDALDFLKGLEVADGCLFDPPYSVEQALRKYVPKQGGTAGRLEYQYACLREIGRIIRPNGKVICFGWDSNGVGKKRGFELERVLLIAHGAAHRDTIVTVERKLPISPLPIAPQIALFMGANPSR
jgi:hypothetical protein